MSRLGALSRTDARARIEAHRPEWRVRGILATTDYGVLAAGKGVGKTFAQTDLGVGVALGEPWFGRFETTQAKVLMLTSEDSEARIWRRADAIATSLNRDPADLDGELFVHPMSFSVVTELPRLRAELEALEPGLVILDPAYRYIAGTRLQLAEMGAVLTPLQEACASVGAPLMISHHFNRNTSADREARISGAGFLEWARLVITAEAQARTTEDPAVVVTFEITGNNIDPVSFRIRRHVQALDDTPDPEIEYRVEMLAEGREVEVTKYLKAADRVLAVLPHEIDAALTIREIGDRIAHDVTGKGGLKHDTIRQALNRDLAGQVDRIGEGFDVRWWAPLDP